MKTVIVIGAGFAGLEAVKKLSKNNSLRIILIDKRNHHLFQPLLYQVATAGLNPSDIAIPIRSIFQGEDNVETFMGEVERIDMENRVVFVANEKFSYDALLLSCGSKYSYFGNEQWSEFAPGLKTVEQALEIRRRLLATFEKAEMLRKQGKDAASLLNIVVVGAGPTGVEMAGAISELCKYSLKEDFHYINPEDAHIYLIEGAPRVLPPYPSELSDRAKSDLEGMGVRVLTEKFVEEVNEKGVKAGDRFIECQVIIWAAGVEAENLARVLNAKKSKNGQIQGTKFLNLESFDDVFVAGDVADIKDKDGATLPAVAPVAMQQGRHAAKNILRFLRGQSLEAFEYFDKGTMATIGRSKAVALIGSLKVKGFPAWMLWSFIHIAYLVGFRNKLYVLLTWAWSYFQYKRGMRLITGADTQKKNIKYAKNQL